MEAFMKTIHEILKKYRNVKMDMNTYFITTGYYEKNDGILKIANHIKRFVDNMNETERLVIVTWYYSDKEIPVLQFMVLNPKSESSKSMFEFRISYHPENGIFYDTESEFKIYQVGEKWAVFAQNILGFEPKINQ